jgi:hypothetical protein
MREEAERSCLRRRRESDILYLLRVGAFSPNMERAYRSQLGIKELEIQDQASVEYSNGVQ